MKLLNFSRQKRFVNRFCLGADPEWIFGSREDPGLKASAKDFGMKTGCAFGMDSNGRLAELRAYPSRWAVEVVAGIAETLRWVPLAASNTLAYDYVAGAHKTEDSLGGHVHLGRKRPYRADEILALDALNHALAAAGVFPLKEWNYRRSQRGGRFGYGQDGDIRLQGHGYEYRAFPSWLDSPRQAFLVLTLSKLAVVDPKLCVALMPNVAKLITHYKYLDDDALLADFMLASGGLPTYIGEDFLGRWGGRNTVPKRFVTPQIFPACIKPDPLTVRQVWDHIVEGSVMAPTLPQVTWSPAQLPQNYHSQISLTNCDHQVGIGEIVYDMVCHENDTRSVGAVEGDGLTVDSACWKAASTEERNRFRTTLAKLNNAEFILHPKARFKLSIGSKHRSSARVIKIMREALTCGMFPIWKAGAVTESSYSTWAASRVKSASQQIRGLIFSALR